jgi:hypothetical protein
MLKSIRKNKGITVRNGSTTHESRSVSLDFPGNISGFTTSKTAT